MKKKYLVLSLFVVAALMVMNTQRVNSNIYFSPPGANGDASAANTCGRSQCHDVAVQTPSVGDVTFNIGTGSPNIPITPSFEYVPGTVYNLGLVLNQSATRYGFQVSVADANLAQAGSWTLTSTANDTITSAFNRSYVGHKNASSVKTWGWKWTAPAAGTGPVTFYYAYNLANGDGTRFNDAIFKNSITIQEQTVGINDIDEKLSGLSLFPSQVTSQFSLAFDLKEASKVSAQLYSLSGAACHVLMDEDLGSGNFSKSFDISSVPSGVYLVKLSVGEASVTRKLMKL